jgi:hypothetical protein
MQLKPSEKLGGIDAVLVGGGTISGRITLEGGGAAPSTLVDIFDTSGVIVDTQVTAGDGTYQSDMLPAGTYHLRAVPRSSEYSVEWYDNGNDLASSTAIEVLANNDTGGRDMVLQMVIPEPVAAGEPSVGDAESRLPLEAVAPEPGVGGDADESAGSEATEGTGGGEAEDETGSEDAAEETGTDATLPAAVLSATEQ